MRVWFLFIFFIGSLITLPLSAQELDSLTGNGKPRINFKIASRRSFVSGERIKIRGVRLGVEFNRKYRVGAGYYSSNLFGLRGETVVSFRDAGISPDPLEVDVGIRYGAIYGEYLFVRNKHWNISADLQLGIGKADKVFFREDGIFIKNTSLNKHLIESTFEIRYLIVPWFGVSGGFGYRFLLNDDDPLVRDSFNSPIYVLKLKWGISYVLKKIFRPNRQ